MKKLEQLYNAIQQLQELGVEINEELLKETYRVEEEIIQKEILPALKEEIGPVLSKIKRELVLVFEYVPGDNLVVNITEKKKFKFPELSETEKSNFESNLKSQRVNIENRHEEKVRKKIKVTFPDGFVIYNNKVSATLCDVIDKIGPDKVTKLGIKLDGINLVTQERFLEFQQHEISNGYLVNTHSSTKVKQKQLEEISNRLNLNLRIELL